MGLFTEKYNSPFDNEESRRSYNETPTALHIKPAGYLTTRSAMFLGFTVLSLCIEFKFEGGKPWWPVLCSLVVLLVWTFSFRFFMPRKLAIVNLIICCGLFFGACYVSRMFGWCQLSACVGFIPMALGMMTLTRFCADGRDDYEPASITMEVFLPYLAALFASASGFVVMSYAERKYIFISLITATFVLIVTARLFSFISGTPHYFTSKALTEFWNIPVADFEEFRRFCVARMEFAVTCAGVLAVIYAVSFFLDASLAELIIIPAALLVSIGLGALMIVAGRGGDRKSVFGTRYFMSEAIIGAALLTLPFQRMLPAMPGLTGIVSLYVFILGGDILVTGLLAVIRRRLIFVSKSKYTDGLPFYLIMFSLVMMLFETALYQIPGII